MQKIFLLISFLISLFSRAQLNTTADQPVKIRSLVISIKADAFSATTQMDIELFNPNNRILDGELNFSLHESQVVTGFAIDINEKMREGVVVEKQKGRVAYENTIRRKVDPGLLEITEGNNYRVRVYPMPAKGSRKIRIDVHQNLIPVDKGLEYFLPLHFQNSIDRFSTNIEVRQSLLAPVAGPGLLKDQIFSTKGTAYFLEWSSQNFVPDGSLAFSIPIDEAGTSICVDDSNYFAARVRLPPAEEKKHAVDRVAVFWDISSSASKRDIEKEIKFLESYVRLSSPESLEIICFSNDIHDMRLFTSPANRLSIIKNYLRSQIYDGGTQMGILDCSKYNADEFFLFSDGISNFGESQMKLSDKPVYCISTSSSTDPFLLRYLASASGGKYIDMQSSPVESSIKFLEQGEWNFFKEEHSAGITDPVINLSKGWLFIIGKAEGKTGDIAVALRSGTVQKIETISIRNSYQCDSADLKKTWAAVRYRKLREAYNRDEGEIMALAKKYTLVTPNTSLIVLDNLDDYFQYDITPPQDLLEEYYRRFYVRQKNDEQRKLNEASEKIRLLQATASSYNDRIAWWDRNMQTIVLSKLEPSKKPVVGYNASDKQINSTNNANNQNPGTEASPNFLKSNALEEVVVIGYGSQRRRDITGAVTSITTSQIPSSTSIATALEGRVAGVQVYNNTGQPGSVANIGIRGLSSSQANAQPLYVLDGLPIDASEAMLLNTDDLETITVLKDASATALYGSRGSNGVIVLSSKRGRASQRPTGIPKYKNLEDTDYVEELKTIDREQKYAKYLEMKKTKLGESSSFYFDVAEHLFNEGLKKQALRVLTNLAEINIENHQLLRAMAYMFETWGDYDEAVRIYQKVLTIKEEEPQSYRDLALAYERQGNVQKAVDILYQVLTKDWKWYEGRYNGLRGIILNELNNIIALNKGKIDISQIASEIIKPLPVDLRIVIDWNKDETDIDLHVVEPGGEECFYSHRETKKGGRLSEDFTQGYGPEEFEVKNAASGSYRVRVNYFGDRYQKQQVPSFIKVVIYKNYGKENQTVDVQNLIMDGQNGMIEIADVRF